MRLGKARGSLIFKLFLILSFNSIAGKFLGELNWQQADELIKTQTVIIPFAAGAKEHGPHLPMSTDQIVMEYLLKQAAESSQVVIAPAISHGWFPAFREYPGTEIADPTVFQDYVSSVAESLVKSGAKRLVFFNLGIGKATGLPLSIVARDIRANHNIPTLVISWDDLETKEAEQYYDQKRGGHADEGETSIMLHLRPDLVDMNKAAQSYRADKTQKIGYTPGKFIREKENGVFGDPTLATAEKGRKILKVMTDNWLKALQQFERFQL